MKSLYYGDNLDVLMTHIEDNSIDLIYLDPPFNSNRDYNANFSKSASENDTAQMVAFEDSRRRNIQSEDMLSLMKSQEFSAYRNVADMLDMFVQMLDRNDTAAYLAMMTPRLCMLHSKLKDTGSIYLHCDPTASHYMKIILDKIFGRKNFRNEIIWSYSGTGRPINHFKRKHDVILFYCKTENSYFKVQTEPFTNENTLKRYNKIDEDGKRYKEWNTRGVIRKVYMEENIVRDVREIPIIGATSSERLGYPTQKPLALLERILKASCPPDGIVLDPFCGCGTTLAAAESLNKSESDYNISWIGIDLTPLAINVIEKRLQEVYGLRTGKDFVVVGDPVDKAGAVKLAQEKDKYHFENWVLRLLNCVPSKYKVVGGKVIPLKGGDGGYDGIARFSIKENDNAGLMIAEVKSGKVGRRDIDIFVSAMERQKADIGIFVVLDKKSMARDGYSEAAKQGYFNYKGFDIPKVQIRSIEEYFGGIKPFLPFGIAGHIRGNKIKNNTQLQQDGLF